MLKAASGHRQHPDHHGHRAQRPRRPARGPGRGRRGLPQQAGRPRRTVAAGAQPVAPEELRRPAAATTARCSSRRCRCARPTCSASAPRWTRPRTASSWSSAPSMRFVEVNATACAMLGYTREELLALGPGQLSPESGVRTGERLRRDHPQARRGRADGGMPDAAQGRLAASSPRSAGRRSCRAASGSSSRSCATSPSAWKPSGRCTTWPTSTRSPDLPNRTLFYETLAAALSRAAASQGEVVVAVIDLDHFKNVNDRFGHAIGDELLLQSATAWCGALGLRDTVGRLGGDEFALILSDARRPARRGGRRRPGARAAAPALRRCRATR